MDIRTTALVHGTNGSLIIRMDKDVAVADVEGIEKIGEDFDGDSLEPGDVSSRYLPTGGKLETDPLAVNDDANAPGSACIDEDPHIKERSSRR